MVFKLTTAIRIEICRVLVSMAAIWSYGIHVTFESLTEFTCIVFITGSS